ncbi:MAG: alanine racemase [Candidatus Adiutrix sp.]|jgi:alanine racemase|nr:alanine racemase [Candidatus Adiutrix sp.]
MVPDFPSTNKVFINMTAMRHNFREVKRLAGDRQIMAMVKADAYGHGLVSSAANLLQAGADSLGVMEVGEGLTLREHGLMLPIHVMGEMFPEMAEAGLRHDLSFFTAGPEQARMLSDKAGELGLKAKIHLKIDTGLGRRGLAPAHAEEFFREVKAWPNLDILGLATHLATAGDPAAHAQINAFDELCCKAAAMGVGRSLNTALNSGGLVWHNGNQARIVRVGLMLYGLLPDLEIGPVRPDLRPAMTVVSRVVSLHDLAPGDSVGYGHTFQVRRPTRLAVAPLGYAKGMMRSRSNRGWALIRGCRAPQVGLVSMNASTYDVTDIPDVAVGDNAVLLGRHGTQTIHVRDLCAWSGATPYEIVTLLGTLNPRYIEGYDYEENA